MIFESNSFDINANSKAVSDYFGKPSNLKDLLPADRIEDWNETEETCSFKIKSLAHIFLRIKDITDQKVVYTSDAEKPFPFDLNIHITASGDTCSIKADFDADVNGFMGMMLKQPLTNFLNSLGEAASKKFA